MKPRGSQHSRGGGGGSQHPRGDETPCMGHTPGT